MGLPSAGTKQFQQKPPDKGSFPLDHQGECREAKQSYMECLERHSRDSRSCRELSKLYLECRMARKLMATQDMAGLGFVDHGKGGHGAGGGGG